ncbi:MAG: CsgG/HfaB family protein [Thermoflexibacter sp.]|jgi:hypothetical protein|nr:CsgG/HfaB family protein [Thermoflexibacter sp.]
MKKLLITPILLLFCTFLFAQNGNYDSKITELAQKLASKINDSKKTKVAIWGLVTESGKNTNKCKVISEDFSIYLTDYAKGFQIIDRNHLDMILKEHKMKSDGFIDETTAKQLGKIIAVDVIITGTITEYDETDKSKTRVRIKALDTETAMQFAAVMGDVVIDKAKDSGESPDTDGGVITDPECQKKNFGSIDFINTKDFRVEVGIYNDNNGFKTMSLEAGERKTFYGVFARITRYYIVNYAKNKDIKDGKDVSWGIIYSYPSYPSHAVIKYGELDIKQCKNIEFVIK